MKPGCPNTHCNFSQKQDFIIKDGSYIRADDARLIQRYKCKSCAKRFSAATGTHEYGQRKRRINSPFFKMYASGNSLRRCAFILGVSKDTLARRVSVLAKIARAKQEKYLESLRQTPLTHMQIDDLITIEHTKLKPLSVTVVVDVTSRKIVAANVCQIPAFGHLAKLSVAKYGRRESHLEDSIDNLLNKIKPAVAAKPYIESDEHKLYPKYIKKYFPHATHERYKSVKGCIAGQGELKKTDNDPIFYINHTLAMLRADINRLIRRTWCTTKKKYRLQEHLDIYINFYNNYYLSTKS